MADNVKLHADSKPRYIDLGQVLSVNSVAANTAVTTQFFKDLDWVRSMIVMVECDQQYDLRVEHIDTCDNIGSIVAYVINQPAAARRTHVCVGANGIAGYGLRFNIRNSGQATANYIRLKVQFIGE